MYAVRAVAMGSSYGQLKIHFLLACSREVGSSHHCSNLRGSGVSFLVGIEDWVDFSDSC